MQHPALVVLVQLWLPVAPMFQSAPGCACAVGCGRRKHLSSSHAAASCSSGQVQAFTAGTTHAAVPLNGHAPADVTIIEDLEPADVPCGFVPGPFRMRILAYEVGCSSDGHQAWVSRWLCI